MTYFVTGGAGFIGSHFITYLLENHPGDKVVCYDCLTYAGDLANLAAAADSPDFEFLRGDVRDRDAVYAAFGRFRPDVVVNFAAQSHVERSIEQPDLFFDTNTVGTMILLDASFKFGAAHFHQISTDEVYGELPLDGGDPFTEDSPLAPTSPYSNSKALADRIALSYSDVHDLTVTVSRCSNNYGPNQYPEKLIPLMIANALDGVPLPVYGDGNNVRDWIYVDDHCQAVDMIIARGRRGAVYNIGAGCFMSNNEVARRVCAEVGVPESAIRFVADRPINDKRYACDHTAVRALGWEPRVSFDDGLRATVAWYAENRAWWKNKVNR